MCVEQSLHKYNPSPKIILHQCKSIRFVNKSQKIATSIPIKQDEVNCKAANKRSNKAERLRTMLRTK